MSSQKSNWLEVQRHTIQIVLKILKTAFFIFFFLEGAAIDYLGR